MQRGEEQIQEGQKRNKRLLWEGREGRTRSTGLQSRLACRAPALQQPCPARSPRPVKNSLEDQSCWTSGLKEGTHVDDEAPFPDVDAVDLAHF